MSRIIRTAQAGEDLIEIWVHIAQDNARAADKLLQDIKALPFESVHNRQVAERIVDNRSTESPGVMGITA